MSQWLRSAKNITFIYNRSFCCKHTCYRVGMVSVASMSHYVMNVTLSNVSVTSKLILDVHLRSDSTELAQAVPTGSLLQQNDCFMAKTRLHADDCVIYRLIKNTKDCLQLYRVGRQMGMCFHQEKCSILRVT